MALAAGDDLLVGYEALGCGDWAGAREAFERAAVSGGGARAYEGLAEAARWLNDISLTFSARERAYRLYRQAEDDGAAARMAIWLAYDSVSGSEVVCEPATRAKTGLSVEVHQELTTDSALYLRQEFPHAPWIPVVRG